MFAEYSRSTRRIRHFFPKQFPDILPFADWSSRSPISRHNIMFAERSLNNHFFVANDREVAHPPSDRQGSQLVVVVVGLVVYSLRKWKISRRIYRYHLML